jgi:hypothetical protein
MPAKISNAPLRWAAKATLLSAALLVGFFARRWWKLVVEFRIAARPERAPSHAATLWYERLLKRLARHGVKKTPEQTPREFVSSIQSRPLRTKVERFTRHYEGARFGDSAMDAGKLPALYQEIRKYPHQTGAPALEEEYEAAAHE